MKHRLWAWLLVYAIAGITVTTCSWRAAPLKFPAKIRLEPPNRRDALPSLACGFVVVSGSSSAGDFFPTALAGKKSCLPTGISSRLATLDELKNGLTMQVVAGKAQRVTVLGVITAGACTGITQPRELFASAASLPEIVEIGLTTADLLAGSRVVVPNTYQTGAVSLTTCGDDPVVGGGLALAASRPVAHPAEPIVFTASGGTAPYNLTATGPGLVDTNAGTLTYTPVTTESFSVTATDSSVPPLIATKPMRSVVAASTLDTFLPNVPKTALVGSHTTVLTDMVVQPDGKILLAGYFEDSPGGPRGIALARFLPNGNVDAAFDGDGDDDGFMKLTSVADFDELIPKGLAVRYESGALKIFIAVEATLPSSSSQDTVVIKLDDDGSGDSTFGAGVLPAGWAQFNFSTTVPEERVAGLGFQSNGNLIVGLATDNSLGAASINSAGTGLNLPFNNIGGYIFVSTGTMNVQPTALIIQNDDKILVTGAMDSGLNPTNGVVRLTHDGYSDTFGASGKVLQGFYDANTSNGRHAVYQLFGAAHRLIFAGGSESPSQGSTMALNLSSGGDLDLSYNTGGFPGSGYFNPDFAGPSHADTLHGISLQPDGKILVAGAGSNGTDPTAFVTRLLADGSGVDLSFGGGSAVYPVPGGNHRYARVAATSDGLIYAAGDLGPFTGGQLILNGYWQ